VIGGVLAFSDQVGAEWFAPAGLSRGGVPSVVRAQFRLSQTDRDTLYTANVNPLATFPGNGVVVWGQKTLQRKPTSLDRVNVRRLMIALKDYIGNIARTLVFEQNTTITRNRFLSQVNPYLESIVQRQGLFAYRVIMDDSNNTADVIDRNQLVGQIFIQPTKTAEYIILNFNLTPTGAEFPA
jgi:phage tail sheath protein FI